jgi:hypothetical protein
LTTKTQNKLEKSNFGKSKLNGRKQRKNLKQQKSLNVERFYKRKRNIRVEPLRLSLSSAFGEEENCSNNNSDEVINKNKLFSSALDLHFSVEPEKVYFINLFIFLKFF